MDIGMLWYDGDEKRSLIDKVLRGSEYYQKKYGKRPTHCYVNPGAFGTGTSMLMAGDVRVKASKTVTPNHFWLGIEEDAKK